MNTKRGVIKNTLVSLLLAGAFTSIPTQAETKNSNVSLEYYLNRNYTEEYLTSLGRI